MLEEAHINDQLPEYGVKLSEIPIRFTKGVKLSLNSINFRQFFPKVHNKRKFKALTVSLKLLFKKGSGTKREAEKNMDVFLVGCNGEGVLVEGRCSSKGYVLELRNQLLSSAGYVLELLSLLL
ncbi:hypothetical protein L2E82_36103 [Cichorium intybus]|uniref:Uncharacterized protein n=1 Tax=Cichorium intybus TaxID=13427 RepID=A0ACB9BQM8_CICIN|nr:hypothetical protein L2E82_36103 [Cichorium intybus]